MKIKILFLLIIFITSLQSQSSVLFQVGTHLELQAGTNISATNVIINGTYSGSGTINGGPIPVKFVSFTANVINKKATLIWKTATEVNNFGFEIERGTSETPFTRIGFVDGAGNSLSEKEYSFVDELNRSDHYSYRLKQIDFDGSFAYSNTVEVNFEFIPTDYSLSQNYPNPFNPSTKISWYSPVDSRQTLKIYDAIGNLVTVLVDEYKPAGSYEIEYQAGGLSSGVYYYTLIAGEHSATKKMILMR
jgi:hypothetical protein